jgi:hypothetical protein
MPRAGCPWPFSLTRESRRPVFPAARSRDIHCFWIRPSDRDFGTGIRIPARGTHSRGSKALNTQNHETYDDYDEIFEAERLRSDRQAHRRARMQPNHKPKREAAEVIRSIAADDDSLQTGFETSYRASKHERIWIGEALGSFYTQGEITDVLRMVKGGKEACVYQCTTGGGMSREFVAAKIYRPRRFRNLRNDAQYRQGRRHLDADGKEMRDDRALRAIQKGTERGRALAHTSWLAHELECLQQLHALGADAPEPLGAGTAQCRDHARGGHRPRRPLGLQYPLP